MIERLVLRDLLVLIPEDYRTILFLRYYVGLTQREVAEILSRKQQSVARSERAALKRLKVLLSKTVVKTPS